MNKSIRIGVTSRQYPLVIAALLFSLFICAISSNSVDAVSWNAGRIIDDGVFTNKTSMSPSTIQTFLNSKVTACDTWGTQPSEYGGGTRRQWAEARGYYPPYTCLKDFSENGKSAAQIIYDVSQEFTINPQVLIVLLQKEQGLVTDTWPVSIQYKTATGYGCPDTAPCDSQYFGLTNQLTWSARMFRAILNNSPTWYTPYVLGNNYIQYNPDSNCGGSNVNIQNRSTQALYNYTPYQPNQGALDAGWGQASCGAYGNRNFFLYFNEWFGSTEGNQFEWLQDSISFYYDKEKTQPADPQSLPPNTYIRVSLKAKNQGWAWWANHGSSPVLLGTTNPNDRSSAVCTPQWITCARATALSNYSVAPGQVGTFDFWINTEASPGSHTEYFNLLAENLSWMRGTPLNLTYKTNSTYSWDFISRNAYVDQTKSTPVNTLSLLADTRFYQVLKVKNTGNTTWRNSGHNPILLAPNDPNERKSEFCDSTWITCTRTVSSVEATVAPGETATFQYWMDTPSKPNHYYDKFSLLVEGVTWLNNLGTYTEVNAAAPVYNWEPVSYKFTATDSSQSLSYLQPSTTYLLTVTSKNIGNTTWMKGNVNLATINPRDRKGTLWNPSWLSYSRAVSFTENSVAPGSTATFTTLVSSPANFPLSINEYLGLVAEGITWMPDKSLNASIFIADRDYSWQYVGQYEYTDATGAHRADTQNMKPSTNYFVTVKARNTGFKTWRKNDVLVGTAQPHDRISTFQHSSWSTSSRSGTLLESEIKPGEIGTFGFWINTPATKGFYDERFELVTSDATWLNELGLHYTFTIK